MVKKKKTKKGIKKVPKKTSKKKLRVKELPDYKRFVKDSLNTDKVDTLKLVSEREIAMDFSMKVYQEFDRMIKSVVLFGSSAKNVAMPDSDIDIIILIDDVEISWDDELIAHYRETLGRIIKNNPYKKALHVNTVKLSTWWDDLMRGDPVILNVIRFGDPLIDYGGFFTPLKVLLNQGKIKSTPEAVYSLIQRAPAHFLRAKRSMLDVVDGLYWSMVDAAHAALIAASIMPASPEHIADVLEDVFVKNKVLNKKTIEDYTLIHKIAKNIIHGKKAQIEGKQLDDLMLRAENFLKIMNQLVQDLIESKKEK
ncbi:hypothetical protein CMI41_04080 [Candidatus Pacearchaeota archaeon]|nr:hypothetical protein [Candidatus Pacearchaeota archaeon]|tara:strand:- start:11645 stop:12574 length:930 start_codon:yes stop_codon:yes gene_type:complete